MYQIIDANANVGNIHTPAYVIYENSVLVRVALFNYVTDLMGAVVYMVTSVATIITARFFNCPITSANNYVKFGDIENHKNQGVN
jgi:hypothetical protein